MIHKMWARYTEYEVFLYVGNVMMYMFIWTDGLVYIYQYGFFLAGKKINVNASCSTDPFLDVVSKIYR